MNMLVHGIGTPNGPSLIQVRDALGREPDRRIILVLANLPFGRGSLIRMVAEDGWTSREEQEIVEDLEAALRELAAIAEALSARNPASTEGSAAAS
jgi:hypothetical protein